MANSFLPSFHLLSSPEDKLKSAWCMEAVSWCWYNSNNLNLLVDKNVFEINAYASGDIPMDEFRKMFKSEVKKMRENPNNTLKDLTSTAIGTDFRPYGLISDKMDSAVAIIQKIPVEVSCIAIDPLAIEKKQRDVNFLKNKPAVEADLQNVADRLNLGKVDLGGTEHSSVEFSDSPFGLDLNNPEQLDIFVNLIYSLKIETSFETILQYFYELKKVLNIKLLEIKDQFKFGISCHEAFQNDLTGLPDINYVYPSEMSVPFSLLPDFSDNSHRVRNMYVTPLELFDRFGSEIGSEDELLNIVNASKANYGYCACNNMTPQPYSVFNTFKMCLKKIEVKSVDWVGVQQKKKSKFKSFTTDPSKATEKIWMQNTYVFYWLLNTNRVFAVSKLPYSQRTKGKESFQNFSTNIYKSKEKSAVEASIGENKKAQIADIKLQHAVIKSKPAGMYIDLKYLRGALEGLKDEVNSWNMERLLNMAIEQNVVLGDTEGFDGKNEGQFKAVQEISGGLKSEIVGYMNVIAAANINISRITGVNQQLTGASANEDGLVGLQKLLINASINALHYCNEAIEFQMQNLFSIWANIVQQSLKEGGKVKQAIVSVIGAKKVGIIDSLDDAPLHDIGIFVKIKQREEERQVFRNELQRQKQIGAITAADEFMIMNITNPKDQYAVLAVKEQQWKKEQAEIRQQQYQNQQQLMQQQGQNMVQAENAATEGDLKAIYAKGEVEAQITQLAGQLGINAMQLEGMIKNKINTDRNRAQTDKNIKTLETKSNLENQNILV